MVAVKETSPFDARPKETIVKEQNSFLGFIDENRDLIDRHSSLTYELRDEEAGWKNSPTLESIVNMGVDLALLLNPQIRGKQMRRVTNNIRTGVTDIVLDTSSDENKFIAKYFPAILSNMSHLTSKSRGLSEDLGESLDNFRTSFRDARAPLVSGIRESKEELMGKFEEFLLSNPSNIFAFGDFLLDKKNHGAEIEAIRPFLSSLADSEQGLMRDKKEGILHRAAKKWTDELKERPTPAIIDEFARLIKSKSSNIREWLEFAAQGEDIASFLRSRPDVSFWTTELRDALFTFVSSRYYAACSSIEKELGEFKRPFISKPISRIDIELGKAKRATGKIAVEEEQDDEGGTLETAEKGKYPIGILTKEIGSSFEVRVLTEEEFMRRLQKEADSLDPADPKMMADLEKIFLSLRESAYGLGTEKLKDRSIVIGYKEFPLRSFNPGKRIGLPHDHPDSHDIRIVFVIHKDNGVPSIGLEGIYGHDDYISKFKHGK